jgi:hypothetical protein
MVCYFPITFQWQKMQKCHTKAQICFCSSFAQKLNIEVYTVLYNNMKKKGQVLLE